MYRRSGGVLWCLVVECVGQYVAGADWRLLDDGAYCRGRLIGIGVLCGVFEGPGGRRPHRSRPCRPFVSLVLVGQGHKGLSRVSNGRDGVMSCEGVPRSLCEEVMETFWSLVPPRSGFLSKGFVVRRGWYSTPWVVVCCQGCV